MKITALLIMSILLMGCSSLPLFTKEGLGCKLAPFKNQEGEWRKMDFLECVEEPEVVKLPSYQKLLNLPPAEKMPIVAVYNFADKTGQRKRQDNVASFSTAVTQGATEMLIDALKTAGKGRWFRVVERNGIDHLVRERQIILSTRKKHQTEDSPKANIQPLLFAGMIIEGGIIGYDTNIETGGKGARYLGIGFTRQYRRDSVVISLRAVSTLTGEVLLNVQSRKTILSVGGGVDVFKFIDMDTKLVELEDGVSENESVTYATRTAIEAAVLEMIYQGNDRGFWKIEGRTPSSEYDREEESNA
tara:strand:- start:11234 stop:12139 length:906 start_codon:yes stop_codon:yes gene_type:complete